MEVCPGSLINPLIIRDGAPAYELYKNVWIEEFRTNKLLFIRMCYVNRAILVL
jgi:hypothetical protein